MNECALAVFNWLKSHEYIAIWLEGIALVAIFGFDWRARREEHQETLEQMDIWRKQLHADRVAQIFAALRRFHEFVVHGVHIRKTFGPGRDYSEHGDLSLKGGKIFQEYLDLQNAYYSSYLITDRLAAFMKARMAEADGLQRIAEPEEFYKRLQEFNEKWDVYKMATEMKELF